jgi:hypothetical protein
MNYNPEIVERAIQLLRSMANQPGKGWRGSDLDVLFSQARAIVAELPDPDLEAAETIVGDAIMWNAGSSDFRVAVRCVLAGIKRGREMGR